MVHESVEHYSERFAKKLRRHNFTTPKNYLDFISTYLKLLERKNKENLAQVRFRQRSMIVLLVNRRFFSLSLATTSCWWLGKDRRGSDRAERTRRTPTSATQGSSQAIGRMSETARRDFRENGLGERDGSRSAGQEEIARRETSRDCREKGE